MSNVDPQSYWFGYFIPLKRDTTPATVRGAWLSQAYRSKWLCIVGGKLSLRSCNTQISEINAMIKVLYKLVDYGLSAHLP